MSRFDFGRRWESARQLLVEHGANSQQHSRWSLQRHLEGTASILRAWDEAPHVQLAGLMHSVYSTDEFGAETIEIGDRATVEHTIGPEAELLVYLYCTVNRSELFRAVEEIILSNAGHLKVANRLDGRVIDLTRSQCRDLLTLHLANLAEQSATPNGAPSDWLSRAAYIASLLYRLQAGVPPIFDGCTATVPEDIEGTLLAAYVSAVRNATAAEEAAALALADVLAKVPWVGEPWIWMGLLWLASGHPEKAAQCAGLGRALLFQWSTPWDKRLTLQDWLQLGALLEGSDNLDAPERAFLIERIRFLLHSSSPRPEGVFLQLRDQAPFVAPAFSETVVEQDRLIEGANAVLPITPELDASDFESLPPRFAEYIAGLGDIEYDPQLKQYPGLERKPWWDPKEFAIVADLESHASDLIEEFRALDHSDFHDESESIRRDGNWSILLLYERGRRMERCDRVPIAARIIDSHRTVKTQSGLIYYSRMAPNTIIAAHHGPTNMRLRCHFGIDVPNNCGIVVDGIARKWREGQCVVFDDSFIHEAWNSSDRPRIVLIIDIWHPNLSDEEVKLLEGLERHVGYSAEGLHAYWKRNEAAAMHSKPTVE